MGLLDKLFNKKEDSINSYEDFWKFFQKNEKSFFEVIKSHQNIEAGFFDKISPKLKELREGFWFLAGMFEDDVAELILTPDGIIKNIVFVEELVAAAPKLNNWRFTALKPATDVESISINMNGLQFNKEKLSFFANEIPNQPDEIDIIVVHSDFKEEERDSFSTGTFIFMDNFLGELNSVTSIDHMQLIHPSQADKDLIPIEKLKDYLIWREKEFIEKYEGTRFDTESDDYHSLEGQLKSGLPLIAIMNTALLNWDSKASHPWILCLELEYDGNESGLPDQEGLDFMNSFEDEINEQLKSKDGYLSIGRTTAENSRTIYYACKDFRKPSKVVDSMMNKYNKVKMDYDIYKDKYWQSLEHYRPPSH